MSRYIIIEEINECPEYYDLDKKTSEPQYWRLYSQLQKRRFKKVLYQLKEIWKDVFDIINFIRLNTDITLESSNNLMLKIHKIFISKHLQKIDYYSEEMIFKRKNKKYLSKKINKYMNTIYKL